MRWSQRIADLEKKWSRWIISYLGALAGKSSRGDQMFSGKSLGWHILFVGGWSGRNKDDDLEKWTPAKDMVTAAINFAIATRRLEDIKGGEKGGEETEAQWQKDRASNIMIHSEKCPTINSRTSEEIEALPVDLADAWLSTTGILPTDRSDLVRHLHKIERRCHLPCDSQKRLTQGLKMGFNKWSN